jgi:nucleoid DNA-binding protein
VKKEVHMTKEAFIERIRQGCPTVQMSRAQTQQVVDQVFATLAEVLQTEGEQVIHRFGTFKRSYRPARTGHHPGTGAPLKIKASYTVTFRPWSALRAAVAPARRKRAPKRR